MCCAKQGVGHEVENFCRTNGVRNENKRHSLNDIIYIMENIECDVQLNSTNKTMTLSLNPFNSGSLTYCFCMSLTSNRQLMSHTEEYHDEVIEVLELVWGNGYMAPGGSANVDRMVASLDLNGKQVLDIGCGIGGPAFHLVQHHGANVTCIDLEAPLVKRAENRAKTLGLSDRMTFHTVDIGPFSFPDETFDLAFSSGAFTQTDDKEAMFAEVFRILKPGGWVSTYDWLKIPGPYSPLMLKWFELEGLTYAMRTLEDYETLVVAAGFQETSIHDGSEWYRHDVQTEYQSLKGDYFTRLVSLVGQENADKFVENWRVMALVCERGEMRQGYIRGRKPL